MIPDLKYTYEHHEVPDGHRAIKIQINLPVVPYTRQNQGSRWRQDERGKAIQRYNESQTAIRDAFALIMLKEGIPSFGQQPIGIAATFVVANRLHAQDYSNLLKALEDAANKVLWDDDRWIDVIGIGGKSVGQPSFTLEAWTLK